MVFITVLLVHFTVKNLTADSTAWSMEAIDGLPPLTSQNTRGATSGKSYFFSNERLIDTFDSDIAITKDRPRLKTT